MTDKFIFDSNRNTPPNDIENTFIFDDFRIIERCSNQSYWWSLYYKGEEYRYIVTFFKIRITMIGFEEEDMDKNIARKGLKFILENRISDICSDCNIFHLGKIIRVGIKDTRYIYSDFECVSYFAREDDEDDRGWGEWSLTMIKDPKQEHKRDFGIFLMKCFDHLKRNPEL